MQTDGLPVRGYAQLPGVWAARDTTVQSPTQSTPAQRKQATRRSPALQQSRRLSPMRSPSPSRRTSNLLASFGRSPSPVKRGGGGRGGGGPVGYSRGTGATSMASFNSSQASIGQDMLDALDSFTAPKPPELPGAAAGAEEGGMGLSAEDAAETGFKTQYGVFDLTACGGDVVGILTEAQSRLKEAWLMGPSMPVLRTAPVLKVMNAEHLDMLKKACLETQPMELQLEGFRVRRIRHAHAGMLELDAVFTSPAMLLMKEHWLSVLGDAVDDLEIRLIDRSMSAVHVPLGRVGAEWGSQMNEFVRNLHVEFLLPVRCCHFFHHFVTFPSIFPSFCHFFHHFLFAAHVHCGRAAHLGRCVLRRLLRVKPGRQGRPVGEGQAPPRLDELTHLGCADRAGPEATAGAHVPVAPRRQRYARIGAAGRGRPAAEHHEGRPDGGERERERSGWRGRWRQRLWWRLRSADAGG